MAYDLEEQEQLDTLKAWWKKNGNLTAWIITIAIVAYAGYSTWNGYQNNQAAQASQLFEEMQKAVVAKDNAKILRASTDLVEKFGSSTYASMASLTAAKAAFESGNLKVAKQNLHWVLDHKAPEEFRSLAKLRLAAIALDEKAYDEGLTFLNAEFPSEF